MNSLKVIMYNSLWITIYILFSWYLGYFLYFLHHEFSLSINDHWLRKPISIVFSLIFILICKNLTFKNCRLHTNFNKKYLPLSILIAALLTISSIAIDVLTNTHQAHFTLGKVFAHAILPSIDEEIAFRGILLTLFINYFKNANFNFWIKAIIALAVVSFLFGFAHVIRLSEDFHYYLNFDYFPLATLFGFGFGLLALLSGNLIIPMITHTLIDLLDLTI